jgi:hypothetical protein
MQDDETLETYYQQYIGGFLNKKALEEIIFQFILKNYRYFYLSRWKQEDCIDYLCWLYPRISRTIDKYRRTGCSFDTYIRSLIHWSSREYRRKEADRRITETAWWDANSTDMMVCSGEPEYAEQKPVLKLLPNPTQILILLLKSYYYVSEDFLDRAAPARGIDREHLQSMINELRKQRFRRDERIRCLRERIHYHYYRYICFEKQLLTVQEGSAREEMLRQRLERSKRLLKSLRLRLRRMRTNPSNRQIAELLGVQKSTVDSNLYAVKMRQKIAAPGEAEDLCEGRLN